MFGNQKLRLLVGLIIYLIQPWMSQAVNYCKADICPNGKKHIACQNNGAYARTCGANAKVIPLGLKTRSAILRRHNSYRNRVALGKLKGFKPAVRMATMGWDRELARLATLNVKQCEMKHDKCRSTLKFPKAGQNLALTGWSGDGTKDLHTIAMEQVKAWFDEHKFASMNNINNLQASGNFDKIGHFTAMMQEKNIRVGCATLRHTKGGNTYQFMACNYAYTNVVGDAVYRKGNAAAQCTTGRNPIFKGLCSKKENYNVKSTQQ